MRNWKKQILGALLLTLMLTVTGCATTVEEMYCLPIRSESYHNLQTVMDRVMEGLSYAAPISGSNQQTVQMADLDGDGTDEVILFARGSDERPLKVFVFRREEQEYSLMNTIECSGTAFDQVEYIQMDGLPGQELVLGCQVSDQVPGNVWVYRFGTGVVEQLMNASYRKFLICDLDSDGLWGLMILRNQTGDSERSVAECYFVHQNKVVRTDEVALSCPVEQLQRIRRGRLSGGQNAVFVSGAVGPETIVTDVFALRDGVLTNISLSNETGTGVKTLRNYDIYADDIDRDGELELPSLITPEDAQESTGEHLIRWYAMTPEGDEVDKLYTYHNYAQGWYLELAMDSARRICVTAEGEGCYRFGIRNREATAVTELFSIYVFTGADRSAIAPEEDRFVILKTDSVVYAGKLELEVMKLGVTQDMLTEAFHLIETDWFTGEM